MDIEEHDMKPLYADAAIKLFPPVVRDEIWSDHKFVLSLGLSTDAMLSLVEVGCGIQEVSFLRVNSWASQ